MAGTSTGTSGFTFVLKNYLSADATSVVLSGGRNARRCFTQLTSVEINMTTGQFINMADKTTVQTWDCLEIEVPEEVLLVTASFFTALIKPWWEANSNLSKTRRKERIRLKCHGDTDELYAREFVIRKKLANSLENLSLLGGYEPTSGEHKSYLHTLGLVAG